MNWKVFAAMMVIGTSANADPVSFVVEDIRNNEEAGSRWQKEAQQLLYAQKDNMEYLIAPSDLRWNSAYIEIQDVVDLDGDGEPEALVRTSHGGNCCGPNFFVVSYRGDGFFSAETHDALTGFPEVEVRKQNGENLIFVDNWTYKDDQEIAVNEKSIFRFSYGSLELLSHLESVGVMAALVDVTASDVKNEPKIIEFDLDSDGQVDRIECSYWPRWEAVDCRSRLSSSKTGQKSFNLQFACTRMGILSSKTHGFHDLVCDRSRVFKMNLDSGRYQN